MLHESTLLIVFEWSLDYAFLLDLHGSNSYVPKWHKLDFIIVMKMSYSFRCDR